MRGAFDAPVLIAGGGLVGLSAATFLAEQGIASICVERLKQSSPVPRAAFFHMRTLEMFRAIGVEAAVREQSEKLGAHADPRTTHGVPGSRVPHVWLTRAGERVSTIELPLDAYCVGRDLEDPDGHFACALGLSEQGASLVRPDGFVAWRSPDASSRPEAALREALTSSLGY